MACITAVTEHNSMQIADTRLDAEQHAEAKWHAVETLICLACDVSTATFGASVCTGRRSCGPMCVSLQTGALPMPRRW